jgi:hypothetical protein
VIIVSNTSLIIQCVLCSFCACVLACFSGFLQRRFGDCGVCCCWEFASEEGEDKEEERRTHTHTNTRASRESERGLRCWMARAVVALHQTAAGASLESFNRTEGLGSLIS